MYKFKFGLPYRTNYTKNARLNTSKEFTWQGAVLVWKWAI